MSARRPRIALLVDQPQRDLGGLVLVADALARAGATAFIVPTNLRQRELFALRPDFVLFYNLRRGYERLVQQLHEAGIQYGLCDAEGGVWQDLGAYTELLFEDRSLLHQASCVCMWGPRMAEHVIAEGYFLPQQITVTGCPRFDLYHDLWRGHGAASNDGGADKRILINTNFADVNPRFTDLDGIRRLYLDTFGWDSERLDEWLALQEQGIEGIIDITRQVAGDHPDRTVVVRPHPFEGVEWYRRALEQLPNVRLSTSGPVQPEINAAAVVLQRSCTTAIEAGLAGVPTLSPQWVATPAIMPMSEAVSVACDDAATLRGYVNAIVDGTYQPSDDTRTAIDTVIHDWFYRNDGHAHDRVAETILRCTRDARPVDERVCKRYAHGIGMVAPLSPNAVGRRVRHLLDLSPEWSFRDWRAVPTTNFLDTDQYFGVGDVAGFETQIDACRRAARLPVQELDVALARDRGQYAYHYDGQAVLVAPTAAPSGRTG